MDLCFPRCAGFKETNRSADGKGKGSLNTGQRVKFGRIMFEIDGVDDIAREALALGAAKLPIKTRIVARIGE